MTLEEQIIELQNTPQPESLLTSNYDDSAENTVTYLDTKKQRLNDVLTKKKAKHGKSKAESIYGQTIDGEYWDDADSSAKYRLKGGDALEVFHDINPTGDTKNARSKVYQQIAASNGITIEEAIELVDNQAEARNTDTAYRGSEQFKIDKIKALAENPSDVYYNSNTIGEAIVGLNDRGLESFDIYHQGDMATKAGLGSISGVKDKLTGEKGYFGRELFEDKEYVNKMISAGLMVPGSTDKEEFAAQIKLMESARTKGVGSFATQAGNKAMEAAYATSYAKYIDGADERLDAGMKQLFGGSDDSGMIGNTAAAIGSTFGAGILQMADYIPEAGQWLGNKAAEKAGIDWMKSDGEGLWTDENIKAGMDNTFGYDRSKSEHAMKGIGEAFDTAWDKGEYGDLAKAAWEGAKTGELWGEVIGFMGTLILPGKAFKYGFQVMSGVNKTANKMVVAALKKGKTITKAEAVAKVESKLGKGYKLISVGANQAGYVNYAEQGTREAEAEYREMYGEDMSSLRRASTFAIYFASGKLDGMVDKSILTGKDVATKMLKKAFPDAAKSAQIGFVKAVMKTTGMKIGEVLGAIGLEGSTELAQEITETIATQYKDTPSGSVGIKDIVTDRKNITKFGTSAVAGGIGGGQLKASGYAIQGAKATLSGSAKAAQEMSIARAKREQENKQTNDKYEETTEEDVNGMSDEELEIHMENGKQKFDMNDKDSSVVTRLKDNEDYWYSTLVDNDNKVNTRNKQQGDKIISEEDQEIIDLAEAEVGQRIDEIEARREELVDELVNEYQTAEEAGENTDALMGEIDGLSDTIKELLIIKLGARQMESGDVDDESGATFEIPDETAQDGKVDDADTESVINEKINAKANEQKKTDAKADAKTEPVDPNIEQELDAPTGETEEHTEGFSAKTINALAKKFNIKNFDLQATLNSALMQVKIKKMKVVSKEANKVQYDMYFGKDGLMSTYTKYRKALSIADRAKALEAIKQIQHNAYQADKRLNGFETKYNELVSTIAEVIDGTEYLMKVENDGKAPSEKELVAEIVKNIRLLDKKNYAPANSKFTLKASDVVADMDVDPKIKAALGIKGDKSKAMHIMEAQLEFIDHSDQILANEGHKRQADVGSWVSLEEDKARYEAEVDAIEKKIVKFKKELERDDLTPTRRTLLEMKIYDLELDEEDKAGEKGRKGSLANNRAGIDRINKTSKEFGSMKRWVSKSNSEEKMAIEEALAKLRTTEEKKGKLTKKQQAEKKALEAELKQLSNDEKTLEHVSANLGKQVGMDSVGKEKASNSGSGVRDKIRNNRTTSKTVASENVQEVDEEFVSTAAQEDVGELAAELKQTKLDIETKAAQAAKIKAKLLALESEEASEISELIGDSHKRYVDAKSMIDAKNKAIAELEKELVEARKQQTKMTEAAMKALKRRAKKIAKETGMADADVDAIQDELMKELDGLVNQANKTKDGRSMLSMARGALDTAARKMLKWSKNIKPLKQILYKYVQERANSELGRLIQEIEDKKAKLEKQIDVGNEDVKQQVRKAAKHTGKEKIEVQAELQTGYDKIKKIRKRIKTVNNASDSTRTKLRTRIADIKQSLLGSEQFTMWLSKGPGKTAKDESVKATEADTENDAQELDLEKIIKFKPTVLGKIRTTTMGELMDNELRQEFEAELGTARKIIAKTMVFRENGQYMDSNQLKNSPLSGLLFGQKKTDPMNEQLIMAIMLVGLNWVGANGSGNRFNDESDIGRMLSKSEYEVTAKEKQLLARAGSHRKVLAHSLGEQLVSMIGLEMIDGTTQDMRDKIVGDAGGLVLSYLHGMKLVEDITETVIDRTVWNTALEIEEKLTAEDKAKGKSSEAGIPMVKSVSKEKEAGRYAEARDLFSRIESAIEIDPIEKNYTTTRPKTGEQRKVRGSVWDVPERSNDILDEVESTQFTLIDGVMDTFRAIYKTDMDYMLAAGWKDVERMKQINDGTIPVEEWTKDDKYIAADKVDVYESQNREIEGSIEALNDLAAKVENGEMTNTFYFKWFFSKNGRFMLDSAGINPQTDKMLHRWMISAKKNLKTWSSDGADISYFYQGIAQGLGIDIDKESTKYIQQNAKLLADIDIDTLIAGIRDGKIKIPGTGRLFEKSDIKSLLNGDIKIKALNIFISGSEITTANEKKLLAFTKKNKIEVPGTGITLEPEHPGHAIQAIEALKKYQAAKAKVGKNESFTFKATMVSEYDAVTSGFINKLLQMPILGRSINDWIGKGGIYPDGDKLENMGMNDVIATGGITDAYKTLVKTIMGVDGYGKSGKDAKVELMTPIADEDKDSDDAGAVETAEIRKKAMDGMVNGWVDESGETHAVRDMLNEKGEVTSWARNLFKYPFMIFNYAASIKSIRRNLANDLTEDIIDGIIDGRYSLNNEKGKVFLNHIGIQTEAQLQQVQMDLRLNESTTVKVGEQGELIQPLISGLFNDTYGRLVDEAMNDSFGPLVEANTSMIAATKVMFASFIAKYDQEVEKKQAELGGRSLTEDEIFTILRGSEQPDGTFKGGLEKEFPLFKAPNSKDRRDGISIIDDGLVDYNKVRLAKGAQQIIPQKGGKPRSIVIQNMIREFQEAQASGAVLPIHWIDGTIIGEVMAGGGVLGVHDAAVLGDKFVEKIHTLNEATYKTGVGYNLIGEMLNALVESVEAAEKNGLLDKLGPIEVGGEKKSVTEVLAMVAKTAETVDKARVKFYGENNEKKMTIMNFADQVGTAYKANAELTTKEYEAIIPKSSLRKWISKEDLATIIDEGCN